MPPYLLSTAGRVFLSPGTPLQTAAGEEQKEK
jgi:hypothetical protein